MAVKQIVPKEHEEQVRVVSWCNLMTDRGCGDYDLIYAIANGGARSKATAGKLRAEGVKRGVPDLCLPVQRGGYGALYIEMKREKGGQVRKTQSDYMDRLTRAGNKCVVCHGAEEAKAAIRNYMSMGEGEDNGAGSQGDAAV